jgi:hypothetical protein
LLAGHSWIQAWGSRIRPHRHRMRRQPAPPRQPWPETGSGGHWCSQRRGRHAGESGDAGSGRGEAGSAPHQGWMHRRPAPQRQHQPETERRGVEGAGTARVEEDVLGEDGDAGSRHGEAGSALTSVGCAAGRAFPAAAMQKLHGREGMKKAQPPPSLPSAGLPAPSSDSSQAKKARCLALRRRRSACCPSRP